MGFLFDWLFGEEENNKQPDDEKPKNNFIIPIEDEIDDFEILEDILED